MRLFDLWTRLEECQDRPAFQRVDDIHPLDLYASLDADQVKGLMLVSSYEPPAPPPYDILDVSKNHRGDGQWVLLIRLIEPSLEGPFAYLCEDLVESSRSLRSGPGAAQYILSRLTRWRRMMEIARRKLSEEELRGLVGELLLLRDNILPEWGVTASINGWVGPLKAPQDFTLPGVAVEVKTIRPGARSIVVSSIEQLASENNRLILAVTTLTSLRPDEYGAFSVRSLVEAIRANIIHDPVMTEEFDNRLFETGYSDTDEYVNDCFRACSFSFYKVQPSFPRITFSNVPSGVIAARYEIELSALEPFKSNDWLNGD